MTRDTFEHEMSRADTFRRHVEPERGEYWCGYQRGLRRQFHGSRFGTSQDHVLWWDGADAVDGDRRERGRGYRDGYLFENAEV